MELCLLFQLLLDRMHGAVQLVGAIQLMLRISLRVSIRLIDLATRGFRHCVCCIVGIASDVVGVD